MMVLIQIDLIVFWVNLLRERSGEQLVNETTDQPDLYDQQRSSRILRSAQASVSSHVPGAQSDGLIASVNETFASE
jgi:hypothetical protein